MPIAVRNAEATALGAEWLQPRFLCGRIVAIAHPRNRRTALIENTLEQVAFWNIPRGIGAAVSRPGIPGVGGAGVVAPGGRGRGRDQPGASEGQNGEKDAFHGVRVELNDVMGMND